MRAKFQVNYVTDHGFSEEVKLSAVHGGATNAEDNTFSSATPNGQLTISITNPAARGVLKPGQKYYLDFTLAPD